MGRPQLSNTSGNAQPKRIWVYTSKPVPKIVSSKVTKSSSAKKAPTPSRRRATSPRSESARKQYASYQVVQLKQKCREKGIKVSGYLKDNYVEALVEAEAAQREKYEKYSANAPYSIEDVAEKPIGAKISLERARAEGEKGDSMERVLRRGPYGPPIYDRMGFELDYEKMRKATGRPRAKSMAWLHKTTYEQKRKLEIMGGDENKVSALTLDAWSDRISRDLGIPYHTVEMQDFEEWHRRGFKAVPGEYNTENISQPERDRLRELSTGAAFRK